MLCILRLIQSSGVQHSKSNVVSSLCLFEFADVRNFQQLYTCSNKEWSEVCLGGNVKNQSSSPGAKRLDVQPIDDVKSKTQAGVNCEKITFFFLLLI